MINDAMLTNVFSQVPGMQPAPVPTDAPPGDPNAPLYYRRKKRRRPAGATEQHPYEFASEELQRFIEETPAKLAAALMPHGRAPFAASPPKADQVDFWLARLLNPDGSLNEAALEELLTSAEPDQVKALAQGIRERRQVA